MKFDILCLKIERLKKLEKEFLKRKEALEILKKHSIGMQTLKIGHNSEVGYMNSSIDFTGDEVVDMLELIRSKMTKEIEEIKNELNGKTIKVEE